MSDKPKILVIDDASDSRMMLTALLEDEYHYRSRFR